MSLNKIVTSTKNSEERIGYFYIFYDELFLFMMFKVLLLETAVKSMKRVI